MNQMDEVSQGTFLRAKQVLTVREHAGASRRSQVVAGASGLKFEDFAPVRSTAAYKGQRNFAGECWCSTNGRMVQNESWLERDRLMSMDRAPKITGIAPQPFRNPSPSDVVGIRAITAQLRNIAEAAEEQSAASDLVRQTADRSESVAS